MSFFYSIQTLVHEFIHLSIYSLIYLCIGHLLCQAMSDVLDVQGELNRHSPDFMRTSLTEVLWMSRIHSYTCVQIT